MLFCSGSCNFHRADVRGRDATRRVESGSRKSAPRKGLEPEQHETVQLRALSAHVRAEICLIELRGWDEQHRPGCASASADEPRPADAPRGEVLARGPSTGARAHRHARAEIVCGWGAAAARAGARDRPPRTSARTGTPQVRQFGRTRPIRSKLGRFRATSKLAESGQKTAEIRRKFICSGPNWPVWADVVKNWAYLARLPLPRPAQDPKQHVNAMRAR